MGIVSRNRCTEWDNSLSASKPGEPEMKINAAILAPLFVMACACVSRAPFSAKDAYRKINVGDTSASVKSLCGEPFATLGSGTETWVYSEVASGHSLRVLVESGKVVDVCMDVTDASGTRTTCKSGIGGRSAGP